MSIGQSSRAWLEQQPLQASEQLYAIFSSASTAKPLMAWRRSMTVAPSPIWADTPYADWETVMPYVGAVAPDSEFLDWVATTDSLDWGWLAVTSCNQQSLAEHLRGLTQVLLPGGKSVFFRFWDGRFIQPILRSDVVDVGQLLPSISRCLINGQAFDITANALRPARTFPWWEVPALLLQELAGDTTDCLLNNLLKWLGEEHPYLFEQVDENILRCKIRHFLGEPGMAHGPKAPLREYLLQELSG
ncbi:DUF4123 domain-containing protein [Pseudomonas hefeiensis]|uniref:DUF4123 domain-containing protein n=1 Tax=Pseudomonas hefeiensis TaxID=2738125 RepID=A0ABY9GC90_9PSED|nr:MULTISPECIES: DUF4123 domain-containing protein [unclassified Pseudomonas]WLH13251.1 DUF4123 domain-containing protein [Pseudomonas sp. FP205]WLH96311.1 DUF4123 domain-containing protein [Pseudomonas sp. FP53]WLI40588.1 DUF4123 domain-containing protein [Pseudomonas sp. FP821]